MFLNKAMVKKLMNEKAKGNYHEFARQLDVNVAQLHRVINTSSEAGPKFLGKFKKYCHVKGINFDEYIFLDHPLHVCNGSRKSKSTA